MTVDQMIDDILRREGGYVNHPADRGGPTNCGITVGTLAHWYGQKSVPAATVEAMTEQTARDIYRQNYFLEPSIDKLPPAIQPFLFDCAVNHGPSRAVKFLQQVCTDLGMDLEADGKLGPATLKSAIMGYAKYGNDMLARLIEARREFYKRIVGRDASQKVFFAGWMNRLAEFEVKASVTSPAQLAAEVEVWKERSLKAERDLEALKEQLRRLAA